MRIAFVAMSGIRACDPELLRLGLTLPGFVERSRTIASLPSLGLLTLAGMTPPEHERVYVECPRYEPGTPPPVSADLVAISSFTAQIREAYALADACRAAGMRVVLGGLHVTCRPREALAHADAIVVGEGEPVWPRLVADAARGRLGRVYDARPTPLDLANAPMPAFELLDFTHYNRLTVQASRGCPWRCSFCASSILLTPRYKQKPAEKVLAELDRIRALWPKPFLELADDNAFVHRPYWRELLPRFAERRIRWFAESDLSIHRDPSLLDALAAAGCVEILIGFESPVSAGMQGLERTRDWKRRMVPYYRNAVSAIQDRGIRVNGCFILGLDGQGPDIFDQVLDFAQETELYDVQITLPTPFPGTPFYERLRRQGRLLRPDPWEQCTLFDVTFQPLGMEVEALRAGFRDLTVRLYGETLTRWRRDRFRQRLRARRRRAQGKERASA